MFARNEALDLALWPRGTTHTTDLEVSLHIIFGTSLNESCLC